MADYERLQEKIKEKFHRNKEGKIYIPASKFLASMAAAADVAPKAVRICDSTALRSVMTATDFVSGRTKADRIDERWVKNRESNQRRLQRDEVLVDVEFVGEIEVAQHIEQDQLERFLDFAFKWSGIGAARKMGYGRGRAKLS